MELDTMPVLGSAIITTQAHHVSLPRMCPVSGNPQPGSYVTVRYTPAARVLEVYALEAYLQRFVGGWLRDGRHIRDMEQTIQTIAEDCAAALGVPVSILAVLYLDAGRMTLRVRSTP